MGRATSYLYLCHFLRSLAAGSYTHVARLRAGRLVPNQKPVERAKLQGPAIDPSWWYVGGDD
jgi:hypothetical protein